MLKLTQLKQRISPFIYSHTVPVCSWEGGAGELRRLFTCILYVLQIMSTMRSHTSCMPSTSTQLWVGFVRTSPPQSMAFQTMSIWPLILLLTWHLRVQLAKQECCSLRCVRGNISSPHPLIPRTSYMTSLLQIQLNRTLATNSLNSLTKNADYALNQHECYILKLYTKHTQIENTQW